MTIHRLSRIFGRAEKNVEDLGIAVGPSLQSFLDEAVQAAPHTATIATSGMRRPWKKRMDGAWSRRRAHWDGREAQGKRRLDSGTRRLLWRGSISTSPDFA